MKQVHCIKMLSWINFFERFPLSEYTHKVPETGSVSVFK